MVDSIKKNQKLMFGIFTLQLLIFIQGCNYNYQAKTNAVSKIEVSKNQISIDDFNSGTINSLKFEEYINGSIVEFNSVNTYKVFKVTRDINSGVNFDSSLVIMPHYLSEVSLYDNEFVHIDTIKRNTYHENRQYSPNVVAFDINENNDSFYVLIKNRLSKKLLFFIDDNVNIKNYDQKLIITFTSVYTIIFTLMFVTLVFFLFLKEVSFLYYSFYIFSSLIALYFGEGAVAYFKVLSSPVFGIYTAIIWLKLPAIFYWIFIRRFLELDKQSNFDSKISKFMMYMEISILLFILFLSVFEINSIYAKFSVVINSVSFISIIVALYIPIKHAISKNKEARYLAFGLLVYLLTYLLRIYYSTTLDPLAFWMPRSIEFGLMFLAVILSLGLADKTLRIMKLKESAEDKFKKIDRELYYKELEHSFQLRSNKIIDTYYGSQAQLNKIIDGYFVSTFQQLLMVNDVFYVYEQNNKLGVRNISSAIVDFNIEDFVDSNRDLFNHICLSHKSYLQFSKVKEGNEMPFIIIPIEKTKYDSLCLFLTLPSSTKINDSLLKDLYLFGNSLTLSLVNVWKFQKTVASSRLDSLTKVLNRQSLSLKLNQLLSLEHSKNSNVSVAFIDIDDFKQVNDNHGHAIGDDVLIFICNKLRDEFKYNTYIARYGGDEFVVVFYNYTVEKIQGKIKHLYKYFRVNSLHGLSVSISIGVASATKNSKLFDEKKLLKAADAALYKSKENGKNQYTFYRE